MKISALLFLLPLFTISLSAQEYFVPTNPTKRVALMEEFTGMKCSNCPSGHKISDKIKKTLQNQYIAINIHQGFVANGTPDYRSLFGDSIANIAGVSGYPMASINRMLFKGHPDFAIGRDQWDAAVESVIIQPSRINLAAKSYLDWSTRELICIVQGYYTSNSQSTTNYLNVALLQNNIIGPQQGAHLYFEMMMPDNKYRHNHMLRHLLTGQWGTEIKNTKSGTYFSDTIRYTIPDNYRDIPVELGEIDIVAFVTESKGNILNACESSIDYKNLAHNPRMYNVKQGQTLNCAGVGTLAAEIYNAGEGRINQIDFEFVYNNTTYTTVWNNRHIKPNTSDTMNLPDLFPLIDELDEFSVLITAINGESLSDNFPKDSISGKVLISKKVKRNAMTNKMKLELCLDQYASEVSWRVLNGEGHLIAEKTYTEDLSDEGTKTYYEEVSLPYADCYTFEIFDKGKDGIHSEYGNGFYKIYDAQDNLLAQGDGKYTNKDYQLFSIGNVSNQLSTPYSNCTLDIYPNPMQRQGFIVLNLPIESRLQIALYDLNGRQVKLLNESFFTSGKHTISLNFENLPSATYLLYVKTNQGIQTKKINITK